jgi:myosin heavy subunit
VSCDGRSVGDKEGFATLCKAMITLQFTDNMSDIWKMIAIILHLGNIEFQDVEKIRHYL